MTETPKSHLPLRIEEITADWLSTVLAENYPGTKVTEVHVGTVIAGTATKVRLLLAYNEAGHAHRLPPTMWLKGGFIRHAYTFDESFVNAEMGRASCRESVGQYVENSVAAVTLNKNKPHKET